MNSALRVVRGENYPVTWRSCFADT